MLAGFTNTRDGFQNQTLRFLVYSIHYRSIMTHAAVPLEEKVKLGLTDNLIRVSVGLEDPDDLIEDLKRAFESLQ